MKENNLVRVNLNYYPQLCIRNQKYLQEIASGVDMPHNDGYIHCYTIQPSTYGRVKINNSKK
ncbi:MAG: hypothetical protein KatS3mg027_1683 [Bacteroidia bacterium]|nr:MAG: hypothetical protein KatS3mg027_1683 [Bacteroidia bacterium]